MHLFFCLRNYFGIWLKIHEYILFYVELYDFKKIHIFMTFLIVLHALFFKFSELLGPETAVPYKN